MTSATLSIIVPAADTKMPKGALAQNGRVDHGVALSSKMTKKVLFVYSCIFVLQLLIFLYLALHRFVDGDEGYYLLASRLVLLHKKPYVDFFYMQMPLLPYLYAAWMKVAGVTWVSAKVFAAFMTATVGTLICQDVQRFTRSWRAGVLAAILFVTSSLIVEWFPVAKTFSATALFVFVAYIIISRITTASSQAIIFVGGLLLGCGIDIRSYIVLLTPLFIYWIYRRTEMRSRLVVVSFLSGTVVALIPCFWLFLLSPRAFLFNNLGYFAIRSHGGLVGLWGEKLFALFALLIGGPHVIGIQVSILLIVAMAFWSYLNPGPCPPKFAFQIAASIALISFLPTPVLLQYFCLSVPFLIAATVCIAHDAVAEPGLDRRKPKAVATVLALLIAYVLAGIPSFEGYFISGAGVPGVATDKSPGNWKLPALRRVSEEIDKVTMPGEPVASFWPGDIFETHAVPIPGLENDSGLPIYSKLTVQQRQAFHILSPKEIEHGFAIHQPRVVVMRDGALSAVCGESDMLALANDLRATLYRNGYTPIMSRYGVTIFVYQ